MNRTTTSANHKSKQQHDDPKEAKEERDKQKSNSNKGKCHQHMKQKPQKRRPPPPKGSIHVTMQWVNPSQSPPWSISQATATGPTSPPRLRPASFFPGPTGPARRTRSRPRRRPRVERCGRSGTRRPGRRGEGLGTGKAVGRQRRQ